MNRTKTILFSLIILGVLSIQAFSAQQYLYNTVGVNGYDLVSYFNAKRPVRGNGNYITEHDGVTYLFSSEQNKQTFDKNPEKYLPAYNGWCAFGVSVGKKFSADPEVWEIVDGKLYMNLDPGIKIMWREDIPGNIKKADKNWPKIKDKSPADL
ncbi:MAG: YHS domain-containing (seleno)protein [Thermodesulfobacteriota bacterium]